jgi:hypothetical protein
VHAFSAYKTDAGHKNNRRNERDDAPGAQNGLFACISRGKLRRESCHLRRHWRARDRAFRAEGVKVVPRRGEEAPEKDRYAYLDA